MATLNSWMAILVQQPGQAREQGIMVGSTPDPETGEPRVPRFESQHKAMVFWREHRERFEAREGYEVVRGSPQECYDFPDEDALVEFLDDQLMQREWVFPKPGFVLNVAEDGTPSWGDAQ